MFIYLGFLQFVFKTRSYKERTIHEELAKNLSDLLKSNDSTIVKHVLKVILFITVHKLLAVGAEFYRSKVTGLTDFHKSFSF